MEVEALALGVRQEVHPEEGVRQEEEEDNQNPMTFTSHIFKI